MPQCDNCMDDIDHEADAHIQQVEPIEFKGGTQTVTNYYCSVECLLEKTGHR